MSPYYAIPVVTFLAGWLSAFLLFREHILRLRCERNLAVYRADLLRVECERNGFAAAVVSLKTGQTFAPVPLRAVPEQGKR